MARPFELLLLLLLLPLLTALGARLPSRATAASPRDGAASPWAAEGLLPGVVWRVLGLVPGRPVLLTWSTEKGYLQVLRQGADPPEFTVDGSAKHSIFWPSGDRLLTYLGPGSRAGYLSPEALLWRAWAGPPPELVLRAPDVILDAQVFPAGDRVATLSVFEVVVIWDAASGQALQSMDVKGLPCRMRLLGDSQLATWTDAGKFRHNTARLWDLATGLLRHELRQPRGDIWKLEASPRGSKLVTFDLFCLDAADAVYVWDATTALLLRELRTTKSRDARVDDDAARIAVVAGGALLVWEGASGEPRTMRGDDRGSLLLFPDGRRVAAINSSDLAVWDVGSGERLVQLKTDGWLSDRLAEECFFDHNVVIEVSPCGRVLAACTQVFYDASTFLLAVWDVRSGRLMLKRARSANNPNERCELAVASMSTMAGELLG